MVTPHLYRVVLLLFPFIETVGQLNHPTFLHEMFFEGPFVAGAASVAGHVQDSGGEVEIQEGEIGLGCNPYHRYREVHSRLLADFEPGFLTVGDHMTPAKFRDFQPPHCHYNSHATFQYYCLLWGLPTPPSVWMSYRVIQPKCK